MLQGKGCHVVGTYLGYSFYNYSSRHQTAYFKATEGLHIPLSARLPSTALLRCEF
jgi:hypothetical protein